MWWTQFLANICWHCSYNGNAIDTIHNVCTVQILWCWVPVSENQFYSGKTLLIKQASETVQPAVANPVNDF